MFDKQDRQILAFALGIAIESEVRVLDRMTHSPNRLFANEATLDERRKLLSQMQRLRKQVGQQPEEAVPRKPRVVAPEIQSQPSEFGKENSPPPTTAAL